jgi:hypothetical protein
MNIFRDNSSIERNFTGRLQKGQRVKSRSKTTLEALVKANLEYVQTDERTKFVDITETGADVRPY